MEGSEMELEMRFGELKENTPSRDSSNVTPMPNAYRPIRQTNRQARARGEAEGTMEFFSTPCRAGRMDGLEQEEKGTSQHGHIEISTEPNSMSTDAEC